MSMPAPGTPPQRQRETPVRIDPLPGSQLDQLMDDRTAAKAALDIAKEWFKAADAKIKNQIPAALTRPDDSIPGRIVIGGAGHRPDIAMCWEKTGKFDREKFDADFPGLYERYLIPGGHWVIRQAGGGS